MSYSLLAPGQMAYGHTVSWRGCAEAVAAALVRASVEFHVEPLPDDHWHFTVKNEGYPALRAALTDVGQAPREASDYAQELAGINAVADRI